MAIKVENVYNTMLSSNLYSFPFPSAAFVEGVIIFIIHSKLLSCMKLINMLT